MASGNLLIGFYLLDGCRVCKFPLLSRSQRDVGWGKRVPTGDIPHESIVLYIDQGVMVRPSSLLPSDMHEPQGSRFEGMLADMRALWMIELRAV